MVVDHPETLKDAATVPELLERRAQLRPDAPFLFFKGRTWTYGELAAQVRSAAGWLGGPDPGLGGPDPGLGGKSVGRGDRVALVLPNGPEFIVLYFAIQRLGAIVVPVNPALKEPELAFILRDSGARGVVAATLGLAGALRAACPGLAWADTPPPAYPQGRDVGPLARADEDAAIIYTSGTTGFPKGAVLTHANYLFDVRATAKAVGMTSDDRFLCFLPLFHVNAQVVTLLTPLWAGGSMVLMDRFQPKEFFELLSAHRCTAFSGVPSVYAVLLSAEASSDLSSLRMCICGAAPMPVDVFERFEKKFNAFILEGYGLSEGTCVSSVNPLPPGRRKVGSIGLPIDGQEMRIRADGGAELGPGEVGEIVIRGPNVMRGYWNNEKATAETIADGWLRTGDLGTRDADGYFFISGRKKEMIIRGGENIYPREIEEALVRHPAIAECAVIGLPDRRWGEEVAAFVVLRAQAACTRQELTAFLKGRLADFKLPRRFEFVQALPKTATGKIQKLKLREQFLQK